MTITTAPTSQSTSLFGGMFGKAQTGAGGLFGMLLSLFGQTAGANQTQGGLNALTGLLQNNGQQMTAQMLQQMGQNSTGQANLAAGGETSLPTAADLLALLRSLAAHPATSPELKSLLGDTSALDGDALRAKFASLDSDTQQSLIDEMAALMLQMPQFQMQPSQPVADTESTAALSLDEAPTASDQTRNTLPMPEAPLAQKNQTEDSNAMEASRQSAKDLAMAAITEALQANSTVENKSITAQASAAAAEAKAQAAATAEASALSDNLHETQSNTRLMNKSQGDDAATLIREDKTALSALASATQTAQQQPHRKTTDNKTVDTETPASSAAITATSAIAQPQTTAAAHNKAAPVVTGVQQTGEAISSTDATSQSQLRSAAETTASTAVTTGEAPRTTQNASFSEHLSKVNLSRTGAHIPVSEQVAVQMTRAMKNGHDQMTIKLQPGDLGKIEVKIDVGNDGRVTASFSVDQPATLDLLQKDHRGLERALTDAGLKTDSGTLSFNLRNDNGGQQQAANGNAQQNGGEARSAFNPDGSNSDEMAPAGLIEMVWHVSPDRVDVRI